METVVVALRVVLSLAVVLGLLWVVQRRLTRGAHGKRAVNLVTVVGRQGVGQKASVVVVDIEGTRFVLGVTEQSVNVLSTCAAVPDDACIDVPLASVEARPDALHRSPVEVADDASAAVFARSLAQAGSGGDELRSPLAFRPRRERTASRLNGSILSPTTWQQTAAALRQGR